MDPKVASVITHFKTPLETLEAVDSLQEMEYENLVIIVVDNNSNDGLRDVLERRYPDVKLIENQANLGFAGGCNTGIRAALEEGVEYVLLMSSDAVAHQKMLRRLVDACESDANIGIISPTIYFRDGRHIWYQGGLVNKFLGYTRHPGKGETVLRPKNGPVETGYVSGCVMVIRRNVFDTIGFLDEDYFLYYEDTDFCERAKGSYRILFHPEASAIHKVGSSVGTTDRSSLPPLRAYYLARNMFIFTDKHQWGPKRLAAFVAQFLVTGMYRIIWVLASRQVASLRPSLQGIWDGLSGVTGKWHQHNQWVPR